MVKIIVLNFSNNLRRHVCGSGTLEKMFSAFAVFNHPYSG